MSEWLGKQESIRIRVNQTAVKVNQKMVKNQKYFAWRDGKRGMDKMDKNGSDSKKGNEPNKKNREKQN